MVWLMQTILVKTTGDINADANIYEKAGDIIRNGGLVAFPTETVYGLGGNGFDVAASGKIYAAKGRPSDNPLILHISDVAMLDMITDEVSDKAKKLMDKFWPGPLTMIFNKKEKVPFETTGGLSTVAVRMPDHEVARSIIAAAGTPIAAPSANVSGRPSPTLASHVYEDLSGKIDMIIDGGGVGLGLESTIIDLTCEPPMILRPGYITRDMFKEVIGEVMIDPAILKKPDDSIKPKAPGMKYRHYAPKAALTLVEGEISAVAKMIVNMVADKVVDGAKVGIIATEETKSYYKEAFNNNEIELFMLGTRKDAASIAKNLYRILRECDEKNMEYVFCETFPSDNLGEAIMNRLSKAAGYTILRV